jgi:hypothetical protein
MQDTMIAWLRKRKGNRRMWAEYNSALVNHPEFMELLLRKFGVEDPYEITVGQLKKVRKELLRLKNMAVSLVVILIFLFIFGIPGVVVSQAQTLECPVGVVRQFYDAVTAKDYHRAYSYFSSQQGIFPSEETWIGKIEAFDEQLERKVGSSFTERVAQYEILRRTKDNCKLLIGLVIERRFEKIMETVMMTIDVRLAPDGITALILERMSGYIQKIEGDEGSST